MLHIKARLFSVFAVLGIFASIAIAPMTASANPTVFCTATASGLVSSLTFPTDCSGSAFPTTYHTMWIDILAECSSTSMTSSLVSVYPNYPPVQTIVTYAIQGSFYDTGGANPSPNASIPIGLIPCLGPSSLGAKFGGSLSIKFMLGINHDDYTVHWLTRNAYMAFNPLQSGAAEGETSSSSAGWWDYSPNGPPLTSFVVYGGTTLTAGSVMTVYFE